jgi:phosphoserine phosphatase
MKKSPDKKIKLIFFDMEGTIFRKVIKTSKGDTAPSAWSLIAKHLGQKAHDEEDATKDRWSNGGYQGYVEWMEDTISIHKKYGLNEKFFNDVMSRIEFYPGVKETFDYLRRNGYRTALISGGFKAQADRAQKELKIDHSFAACEYFWDDSGNLLHWNLLPCDYKGKVDFMLLIMKEHGLTQEECAFVGDGKNDVFLAKVVGTSIAFNADEKLQQAATHSINQEEGKEDFLKVLDFIR